MNKTKLETSLVLPATPAFIERRIHLIRGQKVMLDSDLAELYQVNTKVLNQATQRNLQRFSADFMFQLDQKEYDSLRSQIVTSKVGRGGRRYLPFVFTELGVNMLSSVLTSEPAIQMNMFIMRAFVKLREFLTTHKELREMIEALERAQRLQGMDITQIIIAVNKLMKDNKKLLKAHKSRRSAIGYEV